MVLDIQQKIPNCFRNSSVPSEVTYDRRRCWFSKLKSKIRRKIVDDDDFVQKAFTIGQKKSKHCESPDPVSGQGGLSGQSAALQGDRRAMKLGQSWMCCAGRPTLNHPNRVLKYDIITVSALQSEKQAV